MNCAMEKNTLFKSEIQNNTSITDVRLITPMIGNFAKIKDKPISVRLGYFREW